MPSNCSLWPGRAEPGSVDWERPGPQIASKRIVTNVVRMKIRIPCSSAAGRFQQSYLERIDNCALRRPSYAVDTITHGIAGTLIGKAFFSEREGRIGTAAVALGSIFPDSDILLNPFYSDRIQFLRIHRGITHSLIALPFFSLLFGYLIGKFAHARSRWFSLACLFAIGMASHIFLALITSYGTMIWSPVSNARYYWDMTFIVDIVFTTIALLPQLIAWSYSDRTRTMRRAFGVWIVLTLLIAAIAAIVAPFQVMIPMWSIGAGSALI